MRNHIIATVKEAFKDLQVSTEFKNAVVERSKITQ